MYKSNSTCSIPNPYSSCLLTDSGGTLENFKPLSVVMGGAALDLEMSMTSTGIVVRYVNVDMLASGPPSIEFDPDKTESGSSTTIDDAWKFGSQGPDIYDYILLGIPYDDSELDESGAMIMKISTLYDSDWDAIWNSSMGTSALSWDNISNGEYADYATGDYLTLVNTTGAACNTSDSNLSSGVCYADTSSDTAWLKIPHFSGVGPALSGSAVTSSNNNNAGPSSSGRSSVSDDDVDGEEVDEVGGEVGADTDGSDDDVDGEDKLTEDVVSGLSSGSIVGIVIVVIVALALIITLLIRGGNHSPPHVKSKRRFKKYF